MNPSFDLDPAITFTAGAVGEPGARTFFIQAVSLDGNLTLLCEKEQVFLLARELRRVLSIIPEGGPGDEGLEPLPSDLELVEPLEPAWRVGAMSIEYDPALDRIVVSLREFIESEDDDDPDDEEDEDDGPDADEDQAALDELAALDAAEARIVVTRAQVRAMAEHAIEIVAAGRPRCDLCGQPRDDDHRCPALNGHKERT